jgi:hypothetical protein
LTSKHPSIQKILGGADGRQHGRQRRGGAVRSAARGRQDQTYPSVSEVIDAMISGAVPKRLTSRLTKGEPNATTTPGGLRLEPGGEGVDRFGAPEPGIPAGTRSSRMPRGTRPAS